MTGHPYQDRDAHGKAQSRLRRAYSLRRYAPGSKLNRVRQMAGRLSGNFALAIILAPMVATAASQTYRAFAPMRHAEQLDTSLNRVDSCAASLAVLWTRSVAAWRTLSGQNEVP